MEGQENLHRDAWCVVNRQIEHADKDQRGSTYDYLVSMVFAFHALEGYLNFVGEKIDPPLWIKEKELFGSSLFAKMAKVCELTAIRGRNAAKHFCNSSRNTIGDTQEVAWPSAG